MKVPPPRLEGCDHVNVIVVSSLRSPCGPPGVPGPPGAPTHSVHDLGVTDVLTAENGPVPIALMAAIFNV